MKRNTKNFTKTVGVSATALVLALALGACSSDTDPVTKNTSSPVSKEGEISSESDPKDGDDIIVLPHNDTVDNSDGPTEADPTANIDDLVFEDLNTITDEQKVEIATHVLNKQVRESARERDVSDLLTLTTDSSDDEVKTAVLATWPTLDEVYSINGTNEAVSYRSLVFALLQPSQGTDNVIFDVEPTEVTVEGDNLVLGPKAILINGIAPDGTQKTFIVRTDTGWVVDMDKNIESNFSARGITEAEFLEEYNFLLTMLIAAHEAS